MGGSNLINEYSGVWMEGELDLLSITASWIFRGKDKR